VWDDAAYDSTSNAPEEAPLPAFAYAPSAWAIYPAVDDDLLNHERQLVRDVAQARRDANSSYLEARIDRFIQAGELCGGRMPIMLRPFGAITERFQGYANLNHQNLTRVNPKEPKHSDVLRKSLVAPEGKQVVVADFSLSTSRTRQTRTPSTTWAW